MGCFTGIIKYLLFLFNFLIVVCGIVLIAVGVIIQVDEGKGPDRFTSFSIGGFAVAVGVIIFLIAFFGCCGAIKENSCMLTTYAVILIVLFILQIVLGALAYVAVKDDDNDTLTKDVRKVIEKFFKNYDHSKDDKKLIDEFQKDLKCCGVDGPLSWLGTTPFPKSCCKSDVDVCSAATARTKSCTKAFKELITDNIEIIAGVAIGFGVIEFFGAIFSFVVRNRHHH